MTPAVSSLRVKEAQVIAPGYPTATVVRAPEETAPCDTFLTSNVRLEPGPEGFGLVSEATGKEGLVVLQEAPAPPPPATLTTLSETLEASRPGGSTLGQAARAAGKGKGLGQLVKGLLRDNTLAPLKEELQTINGLAASFKVLTTPAAFAAKTAELRARLASGESLEQLRAEAYAVAREAAYQASGLRPHDCQVLGALAMDDGGIAQMATGEGKTLTAVLPLYLNALAGQGAHLITVNDTLAKRDSDWMRPIFERLGLSVGCVLESQSPEEKRQGYACDVTYLTDRAVGFDFLKDRAATDPSQRVQRGLAFALIDEVDDVLIDEAGTPLILSQRGKPPSPDYALFAGIVKELIAGEDFQVNREETSVWLTEGGQRYVDNELAIGIAANKGDASAVERGLRRREAIRRENRLQKAHDDYLANQPGLLTRLLQGEHAQRKKQLEEELSQARESREALSCEFNLYEDESSDRVHFLDASLRARALFQAGKHYTVEGGEIKIIDQGKGRVGAGKRFGHGLHQALEAKEGLTVRPDSVTVGRVSLPELFSHYGRKAGMSGTAVTSAEELRELYGLEVVTIPTHAPSRRKDLPDVLFPTHASKVERVVEEALAGAKNGRPVLVGTVSVRSNKELAARLLAAGWPMDRLQVLNAETVRGGQEVRDANAGRSGTITLASGGRERGLHSDRVNYKGLALKALAAVEADRTALVFVECAEDARQVEGWLRGRVATGTVTVQVGPATSSDSQVVIDARDFHVDPLVLPGESLSQAVPQALKAYEEGRPVVITAGSTKVLSAAAEALLDSGLGLESLPMICEGKEKEQVVLESAGRAGFITVATNMAGRGADIKPDLVSLEAMADQAYQGVQSGGPVTVEVATPAQAEKLKRRLSRACPVVTSGAALPGQVLIRVGESLGESLPAGPGLTLKGVDFETGGLLVIGTERAASRRIDDQLVGRAGRQGAPGQSQFYLSLEDDLLRIFGGESLTSLLKAFDPAGKGLSSELMTGLVREAQERVEGQHLEARLTAARYDGVARDQRASFYDLRESLLNGKEDPREWAADFAASGLAALLKEQLGVKKSYQPAELSEALQALGLPTTLTPQTSVVEPALAAALFEKVSPVFHNPALPEGPLREVVLSVVDDCWLTLQETMDGIADGIHLVAYGSAKPEEAFSEGGLKAFQAMKVDIQKSLAQTVLPQLLTI